MSLYEPNYQTLRRCERRLLLRARDLIEKRTERFVCMALAAAVEKVAREPTTEHIPRAWLMSARRHLSLWITDMLGGSAYYEGWLDANHAGLRHSASKEHRKKYAREARLRWIDWMIEQVDKELETLND